MPFACPVSSRRVLWNRLWFVRPDLSHRRTVCSPIDAMFEFSCPSCHVNFGVVGNGRRQRIVRRLGKLCGDEDRFFSQHFCSGNVDNAPRVVLLARDFVEQTMRFSILKGREASVAPC